MVGLIVPETLRRNGFSETIRSIRTLADLRRCHAAAAVEDSPELGGQPIVDLDKLNLFTRKELQVQLQEINKESILPIGLYQEGSQITFHIK